MACLHEEEKAIEWLEEANLPWLMVNRLGGISGPIASDPNSGDLKDVIVRTTLE